VVEAIKMWENRDEIMKTGCKKRDRDGLGADDDDEYGARRPRSSKKRGRGDGDGLTVTGGAPTKPPTSVSQAPHVLEHPKSCTFSLTRPHPFPRSFLEDLSVFLGVSVHVLTEDLLPAVRLCCGGATIWTTSARSSHQRSG